MFTFLKMFKRNSYIFILLLTLGVITAGVFGMPHFSFAQDVGLEAVGTTAGLSDTPLPIIIGRLIRIGLSVLGIILLLIMLYGGFTWMTAGGDDEKVAKAKKIIVNGVIGLIIISTSYAITSFVMSRVSGAVGDQNGSGQGGSGVGLGLGNGSVAIFSVANIVPQGELSIRNVQPRITFSRTIDEASVEGSIHIARLDSGEDVVGSFEVNGNRVSFTPTAPCPAPNETRHCFDENTSYTVVVDETIKSSTGVSLNCTQGCSGAFTTGSLIDTENPSVSIEYPASGARIDANSITLIDASATDDTGVAGGEFSVDGTLFDTVAATEQDLRDVLLSSDWNNTGLAENAIYNVAVTAVDLAGNTDSDFVRVRINPSYCANRRLDVDRGETGIDCGGDCGSCNGSSCEVNDECTSGLCLEGVCTTLPTILNVAPLDGAPGTFVTIVGKDFGGSGGTVEFTSDTGSPITASIPSCSDGWSNTQIVVEVPEGAIDGPITVRARGGLYDSTDNLFGPVLNNFDVNETLRPSLCRLSPAFGLIGDSLNLLGKNFGATQGDSDVRFKPDTAQAYTSWSSDSVQVIVPSLPLQSYYVAVQVDGILSNYLSYTVQASQTGLDTSGNSGTDSTNTIAIISNVVPNKGGIDQYVSITGSNFGTRIGSVFFENKQTGDVVRGSVDFPNACLDDYWNDQQITVIVPEKTLNGSTLSSGEYDIYVTRQDGVKSTLKDFTVTSDAPTPGLCRIIPEKEQAGSEVVLVGDNFGDPGSVTFYNEAVALNVVDWKRNEVTVEVPNSATTGPVRLTSVSNVSSNTLNFEVGAAQTQDVEAKVEGAAYSWSFSTGTLPRTPELVVACTDTQISGVPNKQFTDSICVNANVYGEFTVPMDVLTIKDKESVIIEECKNTNCSNSDLISGDIVTTQSASGTTFRWQPSPNYNAGVFKTATTYKVTITTGVHSEGGAAMRNDVVWDFTTGASDTDCTVEKVRVSPNKEALHIEGATTEFSAVAGTNNCQVLDSNSYAWDWTINPSFASIEEGVCKGSNSDSCAVATALAEGETPVTATETSSQINNSGKLLIDYTDPYVLNGAPVCTEACVNAQVEATFNIPMRVSSVEAEGAAKLFTCSNELCLSMQPVVSSADCVYSLGNKCTGVAFDVARLKPKTFYRAIISGSVVSESGVPLTRANYGEDYSWVFRTRDSEEVCALSRISLKPDAVTLKNIGERQIFTVAAYGSADSCSVAGQQIKAEQYSWVWDDPIVKDEGVAEWLKMDGLLLDSNQSTAINGCTSSCLASGSKPYAGACGNSSIEKGEDCDDGNFVNGDGCSSSCLSEGSMPGSVCGDGIIQSVQGGIGEECDDENDNVGDGCSLCLREGSQTIGATCGNGDIARDLFGGGEDCDDGNSKSGDGCSSVCLNEGTQKLESIVATCGNGIIETPYETCDDSNMISGDGCSSVCTREGSAGNFVCGNGIVEQNPQTSAGEDCDGTEGCGRNCLLLGSSFDYSTPSVCGDGNDGIGEYDLCEYGVLGDNKPDPKQIAVISENAGDNVNVDTQKAEGTIHVSALSSNVSAEANIALSCVAKDDDDCQEKYGPATNRCCMKRPVPTISPLGTDVCRNSAMYAIFDQPMDTTTFNNNVYVKLDPLFGCPAGHATMTADGLKVVSNSNHNIFARAWSAVVRFVAPRISAQEVGDCVVPITGFEQRTRPDGKYQVMFRYATALLENANYEVVLKGDTLNDVTDTGFAKVDGILTRYGVGMEGSVVSQFSTSDKLCQLSRVDVLDSFSDHPGVFRTANEPHDLYAQALTNHNGVFEELEPIPGVYDWSWGEWKEDSKGRRAEFTVQQDNTATVKSTEESGRVHITAEATITADATPGAIDEITGFGKTVTGNIAFNAVICQNPWPAYGTNFPYENDDYNFSMYFCRDNGEKGPLGDLPTLSDPTKAGDSGTDLILDEYFLPVNDGSHDAIGIRIAKNPNYLSPSEWYLANGLLGTPREIKVDGFEAIEVGRSVYVSAPNIVGGDIFSNIYVFSYNELASSDTQNIFAQLLANLQLLTNKTVNLCVDDQGAYTRNTCSSDWDCKAENEVSCGADGLKLRRDMQRLTDAQDIALSISAYGKSNGRCSLTTSQVCSLTSDCPGSEVCLPSVPQLEAGTFLRSVVASTWGSWNQQLAGELGTSIPKDPLNGYNSMCGDGSTNVSFTAESCVNETSGQYICPVGSYAYHYFSKGPFGYQLNVDLEYSSETEKWATPFDRNTSDAYEITAGGTVSNATGFSGSAFCDGTVYGASNVCGDGVVGLSEVCELGQRANAQPSVCADGSAGTIAQVCKSDCTGYQNVSIEECVSISCGNGVVEGQEKCDDGTFNGRYGYCGNNCTYTSALYCGDGSISAGELCDCGSSSVSGRTVGNTRCSSVNGTYSANPSQSCSWDCSGSASFCGDGKVDAPIEQCDGNNDEYSGRLCATGDRGGLPCESTTDCPDVRNNRNVTCGCNASWCQFAVACPSTTVCIAGDVNKVGYACVIGQDCGVNGVCSPTPVQTTRTKTCNDDGASGQRCNWNSANWRNIACRASVNCGNGIVESGEQCDDGNTNTNDSCTNVCTKNTCGDGYINVGVEDCDEGSENGKSCSASYGSSCSSCSSSCRLLGTSGTFCGDGVINGGEYCDGDAIPNSSSGICNGGINNGVSCTSNSNCELGVCAPPVCANDCKNTCPNTYKTQTIEMRTNQVGATRSTSVSIEPVDATRLVVTANKATLYIPQCTAATTIAGDIILENVDYPDAYVVYVTDLSGSMVANPRQSVTQYSFYNRIDAVREGIIASAHSLFEELGEGVRIATVGYRDNAVLDSNAGMYIATPHVDIRTNIIETNEDDIATEVNSYTLSGESIYAFEGLEAAKKILDSTSNVNSRKIAVMVSDGIYCGTQCNNNVTSQPKNPSYIACQMKDAGYELYTLSLLNGTPVSSQPSATLCAKYKKTDGTYKTYEEYTSSSWYDPSFTFLLDMAQLSSGNPNLENGIDYALNGDTEILINQMYETVTSNIIDSVLGVRVTLTAPNGQTTTKLVKEGNNQAFPWPKGFSCSSDAEKTLTLETRFNGAGTLKISNVQFQYCAP